jgi:hypothetical protein
MTLGEYRVGITFNPGGNPHVNEIKRAAADLIDLVYNMPEGDPNITMERDRLVRLAADCFETGAMHAVKAATKGPMA